MSHEGHYGTRHTALWSCTHIPNSIDLSRDKNVMARTRKYYLKNNYLILRSKIKVPRRSLRYATHHLMVMHIRTIFQWTVLLDLFELFDLEVKGQGPTKVITVRDTALWSCTYDLSVNEQFCWIYLNDLTLRSKSHKGHYSTWHTALWSCTHIPIIIDLSRKTKMLWPGQENTIEKTIIWPWGQRSHKGQYGTRHTALWSCTHIRNIIDISQKTK
jgi:hypothetical protein